MSETFSTTAILGAGSWGTALALHLARNNRPVHLWEFDKAQVKAMQQDRENSRYLPGEKFPDLLLVTDDLHEALKSSERVLIVVPSHAFESTLKAIKPIIHNAMPIAWATKGIDPHTHHLMHQLVQDVLGQRAMAVLSGPSFAKEVGVGMPTAVVVASNDDRFASDLVSIFNCAAFRVYTSTDMVGVQLGGAVKNVIALAAGTSDGLGFGANSRCGLITRGLAEMMRLGEAMGADRETFMGLSGLGDLVLTCTDNQSRNRRFGLAIGEGKNRDEAEKAIGQVVEGAHTVDQVMALAREYKVEMPISKTMYRILHDELSPVDAVKELLSRTPKAE